MKHTMIDSLVYLLIALVLLNGALYLLQPGMIFYPSRELQATPAAWQLEYQDVSLHTGDGVRLHGWYLPHPQARRVLLFFHGNAGNISHRRASLEVFHRLGLNVLIFDYRGYGHSEGSPGEAGLYQDARAAWRYLTETKGFAGEDIVLFGRSLGGAVASRLAAEVTPGGLILESTISSARDFAKAVFPLFSRLVIMRYDFDTVAQLKDVDCPVLVLHSRADEIMPFALGRRVYEAAKSPKAFWEMRGDHNGGFQLSQPEYERTLAGFIAGRIPEP